MAGSTAVGRVAGNVYEFAFTFTLRADFRWSAGRHSETALTALPVSQAAARAYISLKSARG